MIRSFLAVTALLPLAMPLAAYGSVNDFTVSLFSTTYDLSGGESCIPVLTTTERTVARFLDFDQNHGIIRSIPTQYNGQDNNLRIISVKNEKNKNWNCATYTTGGGGW